MRRTAARSAGFTLIELVVAIAIMGILMTLAAPAMQRVVAKQRLRSASFNLVGDLTLARSEALKRRSSVVLEPLATGNWTAGWRLRNATDNAILAQRPALGTSVAVSPAPASVTFDSAAQVVGGLAVQFGMNDGNGNQRCIQLDPTGRPKTLSTACP